jgi:ribosomal protein S4
VNIRRWLKERENPENSFICPPNQQEGNKRLEDCSMKHTEFTAFTLSAFSTRLEAIICTALLAASDNKADQLILARAFSKTAQRLLNNRRIDPLLCNGELISCL